jgi:hypothetical protein
MTTDGYELFVLKNSPFGMGLQVTLRKNTVGFNHAVYKALGEPTAIQLLYNRERRSVGIRAAAPDAPGAFRVQKQEHSLSYMTSASSFMSYYGIQHDAPHRYPAEQHGDMITVDLAKGFRVPSRGGVRPQPGRQSAQATRRKDIDHEPVGTD